MRILKSALAILLALALGAGCFLLPSLTLSWKDSQLETRRVTVSVLQAEAEEAASEAEEIATPSVTFPTATEEATAAEVEAAETAALPLTEETVSFRVWHVQDPSEEADIENSAVLREIAERTGITLDYTVSKTTDALEQFQLMAAAGDLCDVVENVGAYYYGGLTEAVKDEVVMDLSGLMATYCPNYMAALAGDAGTADYAYTADGRIGAIYRLSAASQWTDCGFAVSRSALEEVGLEAPETLDELAEVLMATGTTLPMTDELLQLLAQSCGTSLGIVIREGQAEYGPMMDTFEDFVRYVNTLFTEGLVGTTTEDSTEGTQAVTLMETGDLAAIEAQGADDYVFLGQLEGSSTALYPETSRVMTGTSWSIDFNCENPELILRLIDYFFTTEGAQLANLGIEGDAFTCDSQGLPQLSVGESQTEYAYPLSLPTWQDLPEAADPEITEAIAAWNMTAGDAEAYQTVEQLSFTQTDWGQYSSIMGDIELYITEQLQYYWENDVSLDDILEETRTNLTNLGLYEALAFCQDALDAME